MLELVNHMDKVAVITPAEFALKLDKVDSVSRPCLSPQFVGRRYLSIETFKRDGQGVKTPVWFVEVDDGLYVWTSPVSGKVKRIRNNPNVRVASCSVTGKTNGPWVDANAQLVPSAQVAHITGLFRKKYGLQFWLVARFNKTEQVVIRLDNKAI